MLYIQIWLFQNWVSLRQEFRATLKGLVLMKGRFRADLHENYLAVSINLGSLSYGCPYNKSPTIWGLCIEAPHFWKLPDKCSLGRALHIYIAFTTRLFMSLGSI